jgi:hypothetical protein
VPPVQLCPEHWVVGYTHAPLVDVHAVAPHVPPVTQALPQQ